jgi:hypothetical protein
MDLNCPKALKDQLRVGTPKFFHSFILSFFHFLSLWQIPFFWIAGSKLTRTTRIGLPKWRADCPRYRRGRVPRPAACFTTLSRAGRALTSGRQPFGTAIPMKELEYEKMRKLWNFPYLRYGKWI